MRPTLSISLGTLLFAIGALCFGDAQASTDFKIRNVLVTEDNADNKRYIAVLDDNDLIGSDWVIVFGEKGGELKIRRFISTYSIYLNSAVESTEVMTDDFYKITITSKENSPIRVRMEPKDQDFKNRERYTYELEYARTQDEDAWQMAREAAESVMAYYDDVVNAPEIKSMRQFKNLLFVYSRMIGYDTDFSDLPFSSYDLQIESYFNYKPANREIAKVERIDISGKSDAVSQALLGEDDVWTAPADIPEPADSYEEEEATYFYFNTSSRVEGLKDRRFKKAAEKFLKYEVVEVEHNVCEDWGYITPTFNWVFKDGSIFTYGVGTECD